MIQFLIDHNVPKSVGVFLKQKHDVKLVKDVDPEMSDIQVVKLAKQEKRVIVTNDKDFLAIALEYAEIDMIIFDYFDQKSDVRIDGLKKILPHLEVGFGVVVLN